MADEDPAIVMDCGSGMCKAGLAGHDVPSVMFPSLIGRPQMAAEAEQKSSYVGDCSQALRSLISINYPIERGIVTNWDDMETIWRFIYDDRLNVDPRDMPLLLSEPILNPKANRETTAQVMFEKLGIPRLMMQNQGLLSFIWSGRNIALMVDIGEGASHTMAFYESHLVSHATRLQPLAGMDVTRYLSQLLQSRGVYLCSSAEQQVAKQIKESLCYVTVDFDSEKFKQVKKEFTLPDGERISIGQERFMSTEILFQPSLVGLSTPGLHEMVYDTLSACEIDVQRDIWFSIFLSGGGSMFPGLQERMIEELEKLSPGRSKRRWVHAPEERFLSTWIGGSVLGSLSLFESQCITKAQYEEYGPELFSDFGAEYRII